MPLMQSRQYPASRPQKVRRARGLMKNRKRKESDIFAW
jgi:hypothetical protein